MSCMRTAGCVVYDKHHRTPEMHWIDYGLGGLTSEALRVVDERERDLAALYHRLARIGSLYGFLATERFYEIGTPGALAETNDFLASLAHRA